MDEGTGNDRAINELRLRGEEKGLQYSWTATRHTGQGLKMEEQTQKRKSAQEEKEKGR